MRSNEMRPDIPIHPSSNEITFKVINPPKQFWHFYFQKPGGRERASWATPASIIVAAFIVSGELKFSIHFIISSTCRLKYSFASGSLWSHPTSSSPPARVRRDVGDPTQDLTNPLLSSNFFRSRQKRDTRQREKIHGLKSATNMLDESMIKVFFRLRFDLGFFIMCIQGRPSSCNIHQQRQQRLARGVGRFWEEGHWGFQVRGRVLRREREEKKKGNWGYGWLWR